jgi:hypothetical protein
LVGFRFVGHVFLHPLVGRLMSGYKQREYPIKELSNSLPISTSFPVIILR